MSWQYLILALLGILKKGDANSYLNFLSSTKVLFFRVLPARAFWWCPVERLAVYWDALPHPPPHTHTRTHARTHAHTIDLAFAEIPPDSSMASQNRA